MIKPYPFLMVLSLLILCLPLASRDPSDPVHWGYEGEVGPEHWGELSPEFAACGTGREQSPIDIPASAPVNPPSLQFNYQPTPLNLVNNGHSIQVNYEPGSSLQVGEVNYSLLQFHLHALSEHTLQGAHTAMELHLVHQDGQGHLAVVGVMIVQGAHNPAYETVLGHMPEAEAEPVLLNDIHLNAVDLLPVEQSYYHYQGSLTTPPCSEGVAWFVMASPVELSAEQIAAFQRLYDHNYRPVQPLNERTFLLNTTSAPLTSTSSLPFLLIGIGLLAVGILVFLFRRSKRTG